MQDTSAWTPVTAAPATVSGWQDTPPPPAPRLPEEADTGFVAGAQRGAEKVAQGAKAAVQTLANPPKEGPVEAAVGAAKQIPAAIKGIPAMVDKADKMYQEDPGGFIGEGLTGAAIPQLAGSLLFKGSSALTSAADEKAAEITGKMGFSADAKAAYLQSRAEAVKANLTTVKAAAQKQLNLRQSAVIGTIDKQPGAISSVDVRANMMDAFGDSPSAAPVEVSRIIATENPGNMSFGQLNDLNKKIWEAKMSAKGADKAALNEAYAKNAQMLDKVAATKNLGDEWSSSNLDFKQFYADWGKKSNLSKSMNADDYRQIMNPLDSPTTVEKLRRYKEAGADPVAIQTEQKAYRVARAKGESLGWHGIAGVNALDAVGGAVGGAVGHSVGGYPGAVAGFGIGAKATRAIRTSPFAIDAQYPSTLPPVE